MTKSAPDRHLADGEDELARHERAREGTDAAVDEKLLTRSLRGAIGRSGCSVLCAGLVVLSLLRATCPCHKQVPVSGHFEVLGSCQHRRTADVGVLSVTDLSSALLGTRQLRIRRDELSWPPIS